jgi:hypothetical protein
MALLDLYRRLVKGSMLSTEEVDANFSEIQRRTGAGWDDIVQEVIIRAGAAAAPTLENWRGNYWGYAFPHAEMNECFINFHIRHNYDDAGGSTPGMIYPHVHFSVNTANTGTIRWGVEWQYARRADAAGATLFTDSVTQYIEYTIGVGGKQYWHIVAESPDGFGIPQGGLLQVDSLVKCRIFRDGGNANDTFPDFAFLDTVDVHVPVDVSSTPNRQFPFG